MAEKNKPCRRCKGEELPTHLHHWKSAKRKVPIGTPCYKQIQAERRKGILPR